VQRSFEFIFVVLALLNRDSNPEPARRVLAHTYKYENVKAEYERKKKKCVMLKNFSLFITTPLLPPLRPQHFLSACVVRYNKAT
jgi:hypothetical protein